MALLKFVLFLPFLPFSFAAIAQEIVPDSPNAEGQADGVSYGRPPGWFDDSPGSEFFEILRSGVDIDYVPLTFEEVVDGASVIARGYLVDVIPGRSITHVRRPRLPAVQTVLLKIGTSTMLKGDYKTFFYVEYPGNWAKSSQLSNKLFTGELLFLLRPASSFYRSEDAEIAASTEADLVGGIPIHSFVVGSSLFTMSEAGELTSPINISREFGDLYVNTTSLDELQSMIVGIHSQSHQ